MDRPPTQLIGRPPSTTQRPITPAPTTLRPTTGVPTTSPSTTASLNLTVSLQLSLYSSFNLSNSVVVVVDAAVSHTVCDPNFFGREECVVALPIDAVGTVRTVLNASAYVATTMGDNNNTNHSWTAYSVTYSVLTVGDYYQNQATWKNPAGSSTMYIKRQAVEYVGQDLQRMLNGAIHELILPRDVWASVVGNETAAFAHLAPSTTSFVAPPPQGTIDSTTNATTMVGTFDSYHPVEFPLTVTGSLMLLLTVNCYFVLAVMARIRRQNKVIQELNETAMKVTQSHTDDDSLLVVASVEDRNETCPLGRALD